MMLAFDYVGLGIIITATGGAVAAVVAAFLSRQVVQQVKSPNGETRTPGTILADVAKAVGAPDLGCEKDVKL